MEFVELSIRTLELFVESYIKLYVEVFKTQVLQNNFIIYFTYIFTLQPFRTLMDWC